MSKNQRWHFFQTVKGFFTEEFSLLTFVSGIQLQLFDREFETETKCCVMTQIRTDKPTSKRSSTWCSFQSYEANPSTGEVTYVLLKLCQLIDQSPLKSPKSTSYWTGGDDYPLSSLKCIKHRHRFLGGLCINQFMLSLPLHWFWRLSIDASVVLSKELFYYTEYIYGRFQTSIWTYLFYAWFDW